MSKHTPNYPHKITLLEKTPLTDVMKTERNRAKRRRSKLTKAEMNANRAIRKWNKDIRKEALYE